MSCTYLLNYMSKRSNEPLTTATTGSPRGAVVDAYDAALKAKGYTADPAQTRAIAALQRCADDWTAYKNKRSNSLKKLFARPPIPRGVYMYGGVVGARAF